MRDERRSRYLLLSAAALNSAGTGLFLTGSLLFFTHYIGLQARLVGLGLSIAAITGLVAAVPAGLIADRFGAKRVLLFLHIARVVLFAAYASVHSFLPFLLITMAIGAADRTAPPASQALVGSVVSKMDQVRTMAQMRVAENAGFTVGTASAAASLALPGKTGFLVLTLGNSISFLLTALAVALLRTDATPRPRTGRIQATRALFRDRKWFVSAAAVGAVLYLHTSALTIAVPLWVTTRLHDPRWSVGLLLLLNTILTICFQVRATRRTPTIGASGRTLWESGLFLAGSFVLLAVTGSLRSTAWALWIVLVIAMVALTIGELLQSAASWSLPVLAAPEGQQAQYFAVFNLGFAAHDVVAPAAITWVLTVVQAPGWLLLALVAAVAGAASLRVVPKDSATVASAQPASDSVTG